MSAETFLILLALFAGSYMAWNIGANDVANAMGTSVGSGALTLWGALTVAAVLEFLGAYFFGSHVSETIQSGLIKTDLFDDFPIDVAIGMIAALLGTGIWLQISSYFGWPVSTTHGIVGGVVGFGAMVGGIEAIYWNNVAYIVTSWVLSPLIGGLFSYAIFSFLRSKVLYTPNPVEKTKQFAPLAIFIVVSILAQILIYKGLHNVFAERSFLSTLAISSILGLVCALIGYILISRIKTEPTHTQEHPYASEMIGEVDRAKKHLKQALEASRGEMKYKISSILEDVQALTQDNKQIQSRTISKEYLIVEKIFGYLQILSACLMAFSHGANDVANAIGPFSAAIAILQTGAIQPEATVPAWALALGGLGIVVGLATWGWRVMETIGKKITELTPTRGFSAEFGAAATVLFASRLGLPISTTHTLVGSVLGVGLARGIEALNLMVTRDIVISWIVTVPACGLMSVVCFYLIKFGLAL